MENSEIFIHNTEFFARSEFQWPFSWKYRSFSSNKPFIIKASLNFIHNCWVTLKLEELAHHISILHFHVYILQYILMTHKNLYGYHRACKSVSLSLYLSYITGNRNTRKECSLMSCHSILFWKIVNRPKQSPLPLKTSKGTISNTLLMHTNRLSKQIPMYIYWVQWVLLLSKHVYNYNKSAEVS